jgi:uncharacterized UPF0160 family protein
MKKLIELIKLIIVHPGVFHADEIFALAWLRLVCGLGEVKIVRAIPTAEQLADPSIMVIDIGGQFDTKLNNYDHHQKGGAGKRWDTEIPYAACGLINDVFPLPNNEMHQLIHDSLICPIDAADVNFGEHGTKPVYSVSHVISAFNPAGDATPEEREEAFSSALTMAEIILENELTRCAEIVAAKTVVHKSHVVNKVLILEQFVPWSEHLFTRLDQNDILYVLFPSLRGGYQLQQVPTEPGSMRGRKPLPAAWGGLRDKELAAVTGVEDAMFCHNGLFVCGAASVAGTLKLAEAAVAA